jgi:hypothetical protein
LAALASVALVSGALWRAALAARHYLASLRILDDPSARELEQISALFECGLAVILLGHAVAAASYTRRPFGVSGVALVAIAAVAGTTIGGSLSRTPVLGAPGLVPAALLATCGFAGYLANHAWASAYLGVVLGGVAAGTLAASELNPFVLLAISVPPLGFGLAGVGLGRLVRRRVASGRAV